MNRIISFLAVPFVVLCLASCFERDGTAIEKEALTYFSDGDYRAALLVTKQLISDYPENYLYRHLLAKIYFQVGDYENAIIEWGKGDELGGRVSDEASSRIYAYLQSGAFEEILSLNESDYSGDTLVELKSAKILAKVSIGETVDNPIQKIDALLNESSIASVWLAKALLLVSSRELSLAHDSIDGALSIAPDYTLAKSLKADLAVSDGKYDLAISLYNDVVSSQPWRTGDILKRAVTHLRQGDLDLAEKDIDYLKKLYPKGVSISYAKGIIEFQKNNLERSIQNFKISESNTQIFSGSLLYLASANMSLGNSLQSEDYAQRYFSSNPTDKNGRLMLASIYLGDGRHAEVVDLLKPEAEGSVEDLEFAKIYGSALVLFDRSEGIRYLEQASRRIEAAELYVMLATALNLSGRYGRSNEVVDRGLSVFPEELKLHYLKITNLVSLQNVEEALSETLAMTSKFPSEASFLALSEIYELAGDSTKQRETLLSITSDFPGSELANLSLAKIARESEELAKAEEYYREILAYDESNKSALIELYSLLVARGQWKDAEQLIAKTVGLHPKDITVKNILANFYLNRHDYAKARSVYSAVLNQMYEDKTSYGLYIRTFIEEEKFEDARFHLERYSSLMPNSAIPDYLAAKISASLQDSGMVLKNLERSLDGNPEFYPSLLAIAKYHLSEGNTNELKVYVDKLEELAPTLLDTMYVQAKYHEAIGEYGVSSAIGEDLYLLNSSDQAMAYWALMCFKAKSSACLMRSDSAYSTTRNQSPALLSAFASYYLLLKNESKAITKYEQIVRSEPNNLEALNNLGWLYSNVDSDKSLDYSSRAFELAPDSPQVLDTYAMSLIGSGQKEMSLKLISRAVSMEPTNETFLYHKAYVTSESGGVEEAIEILRPLLAQSSEFPEKLKAQTLMVELEKDVYE